MKLTTRTYNESFGTMMPLGFQPTDQTEGWMVVAVHVTFGGEAVRPHHGRGRPISSLIADREADPRRAKALSRARQKLSSMLKEHDGDAPGTLAELRLSKGLSQTALADITGMQQSYIARIERSKAELRSSTVKKLAQALDVSCDQIIAVACADDED
ncbi:helix-turn-helix transcriptional regulator [Bordetella sp. BOR01]|uniref:helix-turn-helix domain-containing protein n=1 Tax=Bordetella sp. BOR01 TaxID=2854779 RepID=UPI001C43A9E1|nr:helix-turn-helix transcriptional regulator [Bordetella sp. BOR01]MBV7482496.1 helix-turn-helix transcriptional regulator [Bordetella sp. BOR01]